MSKWPTYKISQFAEVVGGGTPSTTVATYWGGNIPWLTPKDLTGYTSIFISHGDRFITEKGIRESSSKMLPKGAVLLTSRAPIGYVAIASNPICTNQGFKSLIVDSKIALNIYVYYWLKLNTEYLNSLGSGTTFAEISGSILKEVEIPLPPLPEQQAIAEVLSSLDDKIDLLHRNNKTLEQLAETLFRQWFVESNDEEISLSEIIDVRDGTHDSPKPVELGKLLITSKNLKPTGIDFTSAYPISELDYELVNKRSKVQLNDLLFSMIGTLGLLHLVEEEPNYAIKNIGLFKTSGKPWFSRYLYLLLKSPMGKNFIYENAIGTTQEYITLSSLRGFKFPYPGEEKIKEFDQLVVSLFEKRTSNSKQIRNLQTLRDNLLPKLMSGEVRVNLNT